MIDGNEPEPESGIREHGHGVGLILRGVPSENLFRSGPVNEIPAGAGHHQAVLIAEGPGCQEVFSFFGIKGTEIMGIADNSLFDSRRDIICLLYTSRCV